VRLGHGKQRHHDLRSFRRKRPREERCVVTCQLSLQDLDACVAVRGDVQRCHDEHAGPHPLVGASTGEAFPLVLPENVRVIGQPQWGTTPAKVLVPSAGTAFRLSASKIGLSNLLIDGADNSTNVTSTWTSMPTNTVTGLVSLNTSNGNGIRVEGDSKIVLRRSVAYGSAGDGVLVLTSTHGAGGSTADINFLGAIDLGTSGNAGGNVLQVPGVGFNVTAPHGQKPNQGAGRVPQHCTGRERWSDAERPRQLAGGSRKIRRAPSANVPFRE
jgi:hypothetical protein